MENNKRDSKEEEIKEVLLQYEGFLVQLFDKRKDLQKFVSGVAGLRNTEAKLLEQLRVVVANSFAEAKELANRPEHQGKITPLELLNNAKEFTEEALKGWLKEFRDFSKYYSQIIENFQSALQTVDQLIIKKILELLSNIEEEHSKEIDRLKIEIADWVERNSLLERENEALKKGIRPMPKEIPQLTEIKYVTIQCPVCKQEHNVLPTTKLFKCDICGFEIKRE